jgi:hypothetical protein
MRISKLKQRIQFCNYNLNHFFCVYDVPPVILYQGNKSAMALIAKGRSTSDLTKQHFALRFFWVSKKIQDLNFKMEFYLSLAIWANGLTKPTQGQQFKTKRGAMSGWL